MNPLGEVTLIVPFYRNCAMLERQIEEWNRYPEGIRVICVDDGSPEDARYIIDAFFMDQVIKPQHIALYRIDVDIPWNRGGARNLGTHAATTDWIIHVDIDHILPVDAVKALLQFNVDPNRWYRFPRFRRGKADETRLKDKIPADVEYGLIHPHVDSYLVRRDIYWDKVGGYDEDYAGSLGGGSRFLQRLENAQPVDILPLPICLEVYTRDVIKDASDWSLSRDKAAYTKLRRKKGDERPKNPLRFPWTRQL